MMDDLAKNPSISQRIQNFWAKSRLAEESARAAETADVVPAPAISPAPAAALPIASPPAIATVEVAGHVRAAPGEKQKQPLTLDALIGEFACDQRQTVVRAVRLGRLADQWIRCQVERPEESKLDRASAVKLIVRKLAEAHVDRRTARVDRYIRVFWVSKLFGGNAQDLSFSCLREMQPLIERDCATEEWRIVPAHATAAVALWERILAEKLTSDQVRGAVRAILPPRTMPIRKGKIKFSSLLKLVATVSATERAAILRRWQEEDARASQPAVA